MQKIAIVIPCYNEALRLKTANYTEYLEKNQQVYYIFVNDGSDDNTQEIIDDIRHSKPTRVFTLSLKNNWGKSEAVRQGICHAIQLNFPIIGFCVRADFIMYQNRQFENVTFDAYIFFKTNKK